MKRHIALLGGLLSLALGACGGGLGPYYPVIPICYICLEAPALGPTVTLFEDGFDAGVRPDRWVAEGSISLDAIDGSPAPSLVAGPGASQITTADPLPVGNGLQVAVSARLRGLNTMEGASGIRVRDIITGEVIASVEVLFAPGGGATLVYRITPTGGAAVTWSEAIAASDVAQSFRSFTFVLTPDGGARWVVDDETKVRIDGPILAKSVSLSLSADSAGTRFDTVSVIAIP